jgi:LAO/AO transport system kinase
LPASEGWISKVFTCSALNNTGIPEIWEDILQYVEIRKKSGAFDSYRKDQLVFWVRTMLEEALLKSFYENTKIKNSFPQIEKSLLDGSITPTNAVRRLLTLFNE